MKRMLLTGFVLLAFMGGCGDSKEKPAESKDSKESKESRKKDKAAAASSSASPSEQPAVAFDEKKASEALREIANQSAPDAKKSAQDVARMGPKVIDTAMYAALEHKDSAAAATAEGEAGRERADKAITAAVMIIEVVLVPFGDKSAKALERLAKDSESVAIYAAACAGLKALSLPCPPAK